MCDQAPALLINHKVVTRVSTDMVHEIVQTLRATKNLEQLKLTLGDGNNGHSLVRSMVVNNLREPGAVVFAPATPGVVINNVETYCAVARIIENGPGWFTSMGTPGSAGTKVFSVSGDCGSPGIYELPFGITVSDLLVRVGATDAQAVQVGGASGRMIGRSEFGRKLCYDDLATGGSVMVFGAQRDVLAIAHAFMEFFVEESCGYCTPCKNKTANTCFNSSSAGRASASASTLRMALAGRI